MSCHSCLCCGGVINSPIWCEQVLLGRVRVTSPTDSLPTLCGILIRNRAVPGVPLGRAGGGGATLLAFGRRGRPLETTGSAIQAASGWLTLGSRAWPRRLVRFLGGEKKCGRPPRAPVGGSAGGWRSRRLGVGPAG